MISGKAIKKKVCEEFFSYIFKGKISLESESGYILFFVLMRKWNGNLKLQNKLKKMKTNTNPLPRFIFLK